MDTWLTREVEEQQRRWRYEIRRGRVWFDDEMRALHRRLRQSVPAYVRTGRLLNLLSTPIIYSLFVPLVVLDVWIWTYQWICFPLFGIARLRRRDYFVLDRHQLAYLNAVEKIGCTFCSYANGVIAYAREVAARTEQYWCPIRHAQPIPSPHDHYRQFFDYGDGRSYHEGLMAIRHELTTPSTPSASPSPSANGAPAADHVPTSPLTPGGA